MRVAIRLYADKEYVEGNRELIKEKIASAVYNKASEMFKERIAETINVDNIKWISDVNGAIDIEFDYDLSDLFPKKGSRHKLWRKA